MTRVTIKTERLLLSRFQVQDAPDLARYRQHPDVARYQSWESYSLEEANDLIATMIKASPWSLDTWFQFALRQQPSQKLIGDIGFRRHTRGPSYEAEIGYSLDPLFQKQGYMREALQALIDWAQKQLLIRRFSASIDPRNTDSARLLTALGFERQARFQKSIWFKGAWADDDVYVWMPEMAERKGLSHEGKVEKEGQARP